MQNKWWKNKWLWIGVLAIALIGIFVWKGREKKKEALRYQTIVVERGDITATVLANGIVQPQNRLEIKPPINGRIETVLVQEGEAITKNQILGWMSSTERAALLDAARAKGSQELARWEDIFRPTPIIAPLTGLLIVRNVEPGQVVTSQDPILVMSDHLIIRVQVDETDIARVKNGQSASIRLEAYPNEKINGRVDRISFESKIVNNVTIYEVDVLPAQVPDFMRSGMSAEVQFLVAQQQNALVLPVLAVNRNGKRSTVEIMDPKSKKPIEKEVRVGISDGKRIEILEGLQVGDQVLVAQYQRPVKSETPTNPLNPMPRPTPRR